MENVPGLLSSQVDGEAIIGRITDGGCTVDLPQLGQVSHLMVLREAALDRDPRQHYFQILFN